MTRALAAALALVLAACAATPPVAKIETRDVGIAVPVRCAPKIAPPPVPIMTYDEIAAALRAAPNVTARAKIVSDQLLLWLGYGPQLEAALKSCKGSE